MGSLHPLLVHFPIAMLFTYSVIQILLILFKQDQKKFQLSLCILLLVGVLGGGASLSSGEALESLRGENALMELHAFFATTTIWIYAAILIAMLVMYIYKFDNIKKYIKNSSLHKFITILYNISNIIVSPKIIVILSFIGLVTLSITGALGGALVRGPESDIFINFIYNLFF